MYYSYDLPLYARSNLYDHLCAATPILLCGRSIPGDHPTTEILNDLESASYNVNANWSRSHYNLARWIIRAVLRWADMLNSRLKVNTPYILWFHPLTFL